jgi:hypothetical protein
LAPGLALLDSLIPAFLPSATVLVHRCAVQHHWPGRGHQRPRRPTVRGHAAAPATPGQLNR